MNIGITGSRLGLPSAQVSALSGVILNLIHGTGELNDSGTEFHHGCCTGADHIAHRIVREMPGMIIHGHPGHDGNGRSPYLASIPRAETDRLSERKLYRERNRDIVNASDVLIACPAFPEDDRRSQRSGTWQTVRMARDRGIRIVYAWPDGSVTREP